MYTANCDICDDNVLEIFKLSMIFQTNRLKNSICEYFTKKLPTFSIHMIIEIFDLSIMYRNEQLKLKCSELINKNAMAAINTAGWKILEKEKPELVLYLFFKY